MKTTQALNLTFVNVYLDTKSKKVNHWVAIWKTPKGNFCHDPLPAGIVNETVDRSVAEKYAKDNVPAW